MRRRQPGPRLRWLGARGRDGLGVDTRDAIPGGEGVHLGADLYDRATEIEAVADDVGQTQKGVVRRGEGVEEREAGCGDLDAGVGGTEGCRTDLLEVRGRIAGAGDDGGQAPCSFSVVVLEGGDSPGDFLMGPQGQAPTFPASSRRVMTSAALRPAWSTSSYDWMVGATGLRMLVRGEGEG